MIRRFAVLLSSIVLAAQLLQAAGFTKQFSMGGAKIDVIVWDAIPWLPQEAVMGWIKQAATALTRYYGHFPVKQLQVNVYPGGEGGVYYGVAYPTRRIRINLGVDTTEADLQNDWTLTHEMFHMALPSLDDEYRWMGEGFSDYMEPVARARAGFISEKKFWVDMVEGCPKGLPESGDRGLDETPTWGRIYWGGVIYWFMADLEIRERTHNRCSIRDAALGILEAGGDITQSWSQDDVIEVGDEATGTTVLKELHDQMGHKPFAPDLDALWKSLGVVYGNGQVVFDDTAPLAAIRRSITRVENRRPVKARP